MSLAIRSASCSSSALMMVDHRAEDLLAGRGDIVGPARSTWGGSARPVGPLGSPPSSSRAPASPPPVRPCPGSCRAGVVDDRPDCGRADPTGRRHQGACTRSTNRSTNSSWTEASTMRRLAIMQICPWWKQRAEHRGIDGALEVGVVEDDERAVAAQLQASRLTPGLARDRLARPGEPVKEMKRGTGCSTIASPISRRSRRPREHPGGSPASSWILARSRPPVTGVSLGRLQRRRRCRPPARAPPSGWSGTAGSSRG